MSSGQFFALFLWVASPSNVIVRGDDWEVRLIE